MDWVLCFGNFWLKCTEIKENCPTLKMWPVLICFSPNPFQKLNVMHLDPFSIGFYWWSCIGSNINQYRENVNKKCISPKWGKRSTFLNVIAASLKLIPVSEKRMRIHISFITNTSIIHTTDSWESQLETPSSCKDELATDKKF